MSLVVEPLARHRDLPTLVAQWFAAEWPAWYGPGGKGDITRDLAAFAASEEALPVGLVAFSRGAPVGAAALKAESLATHTHLSPWAGAGFVLPGHRGRGNGAALLRAMLAHARRLGYERVYCGTSTAGSLLDREGWLVLEVVQHEGGPLTIFSGAT